MNSKFLHFLCVLACGALIGLGPLRAQNPHSSSDANGSAVTAPAQQPDATHSAISPSSTPNANDAQRANSDSQQAAENAVRNDRGTVPREDGDAHFNAGWIGLIGLLGLLGLVRRGSAQQVRRVEREEARKEKYPRAA